ncbi:MAG: Flp pilus assembly protein TadD [Paracoccaceae bacterium]|jgi:Flp pilus assembly protein TadD
MKIRRNVERMAAAAVLIGALAVQGCAISEEEKAAAANQTIDVIDENDLNDIMLTLADSEAAVEYYRRAVGREPARVDLRRGYALSLARDGQHAEARLVFEDVVSKGGAQPGDLVEYARTLAMLDDFEAADVALSRLPSGYRNTREEQLRGMIADHRSDWAAADIHYEAARKLTAQPAPIYNNIGVSKMARGDMKGAATAFREALIHDPRMFEAKNNLALSYALQREYRLPVISLTEEERAILLHNIALVALRQGDEAVGLGLLQQSVKSHPRRWAPAADKLATLQSRLKG